MFASLCNSARRHRRLDRLHQGLRVLGKGAEYVVGPHLIVQPHGQPILEEYVDSGAYLSTLRDLPTPPHIVEVGPVGVRPLVEVRGDGRSANTQFLIRSAFSNGVPRSFNVSKMSCESSCPERSIATSARRSCNVELSASTRSSSVPGGTEPSSSGFPVSQRAASSGRTYEPQ